MNEITQSKPFDAGVTTLLNALVDLTYVYERRMTPEALVSGLPIEENTLTPDLFQRAAERAHFISKISEADFESITPSLLPCILFLKNNQFCLLAELNPENATVLVDQKKIVIPLSALKQEYDRSIILIRPKEESFEETIDETFQVKKARWFWKAIQGTWSSYSEVLLASFFINLFALASPLFAMNVYDRVIPNSALPTLWVLALGVFLIFGFDFLLRTLRAHFVDNAACRIDSKLSAQIFEHILNMRLTERPKSVGSIINSLNGFEIFRDFMASLTLTVLIDFPFSIIFLIVIGIIAGKLVMVPLILIPVIFVTSLFIQAPLVNTIKKNYAASGAKQHTLIESLIGVSDIKAQNAESSIQRKWEQLVSYTTELNTKLKFLTGLSANVAFFSQYIGSTITIIGGVYMIANNDITMGALIACTILTGRALAPVAQIVGLVMRYYQSITSLKGIDKIMKLPVERPPDKVFLNPETIHGRIQLQNVSFKYQGAQLTSLKNINLTIMPGERIAVIGKIGAGKTTLLNVIAGFYPVKEGKVFLDDIDIQDIDPMLTRKYIGFVSQHSTLFSGTLRDNILLGNPNASDQAILNAITISGLITFIKETPEGMNFQVGERGDNLSGGQRQSVAIARSLLNNPSFLMFDEPTAFIDELNESLFKERLSVYAQNKTLILSTHKPSMLALVTRIIILDRGILVADGPKDEILNALKAKALRTPDPKKGTP